MFRLITGIPGPSGFGSASTAEHVTEGIDASNITVLITGGAAGIGFETARVLALRNAHVIIAARNMEAANDAKQKIGTENENGRVDAMKLDLSSIKSVEEFAESFYALNVPLNILINNSGIAFCSFQLSEDEIELHFATNHLGHFYLTHLLLDKMKETAKSTGIQCRIINLSSGAHYYTYDGGIKFDNINDEKSYVRMKAYGQSKLANVLHANELSRRLQAEGADKTVNSVHPGTVSTNIFKHSPNIKNELLNFILTWLLKMFGFFIWKNVPQGAATTCYVALHPQSKDVTGKYFEDSNESKQSKLARDEELAKRLWDFSNILIDSALAKNAETPL